MTEVSGMGELHPDGWIVELGVRVIVGDPESVLLGLIRHRMDGVRDVEALQDLSVERDVFGRRRELVRQRPIVEDRDHPSKFLHRQRGLARH